MPQTNPNLNPQQHAAATHKDGPLLIIAGAGSGKTKTLTSRIAYLLESGIKPSEILAITFTNKAAEEMKKRIESLLAPTTSPARHARPGVAGGNLQPTTSLFIGTFHSWGARLLRHESGLLGRTVNFSIFDDDDSLRVLKEIVKEMDLDKDQYTPSGFRYKISSIKNELLNAETMEVGKNFYDELAVKVYKKYEEALQKNNAFDFDDLITKVVYLFEKHPEVLRKYQEKYKHILVDEYQDVNTSQYRLIKLLAQSHKNLSVVGDDAQCVLPETQITTSAGSKEIKKIRKGEMVLGASGSGEVCESKVEKVHKMKYNGPIIKITTVSGRVLRLTPNHLIFTKLRLVDGIYFVYLMYRKDKGFRIGIAKGARWGPRGKDQIGLIVRNNQEKADKVWILKVCDGKEDAEYYEYYYAFNYGIPTVVFDTNNRSMKLTQKHVDQIFSNINTKERAIKLMAKELLYFSYPHWIPQGTIRHSSRRLRSRLTLFDDPRKSALHPWGMSRISINTKDPALKEEIEKLGFKTRKGKREDWRFELVRLNYGELEEVAGKFETIETEVEIVRSACLTKNKRLFFQPASHARPTMAIAVKTGRDTIEEDIIKNVETEEYRGTVYDLDIKNIHNYIANDLVVHNSIYAFRGSDFRIFLNFDRDWPGAKVIKLEENYRSTANIITAASQVIKHNTLQKPKTLWTKKENGELIKIDGFSEPDDEAYFIIGKITEIFNNPNTDPQIAILYRTNAQSRSIEQALLQNGIPYRIYGGLKFYDRMEIKDIISSLVYANNPQNSVAAERIRKNFNKKEAEHLLRELPRLADSLKLVELINFFLENTKYIEYLDKNFKNGNERVDNVNELIAFAGTFNHLGLAAFLEQVSLVSSLDTPNGKIPPTNMRSGGVVTLMTVHASKGLEFNQVFVVGVNEGLLPHERSISKSDDLEEERRLMYVAMTRAKINLHLTYFDIPSRFLYEIPQELTVFKNHTMSHRSLTSFEDEDYIEYD